jgi:hypothetical protein
MTIAYEAARGAVDRLARELPGFTTAAKAGYVNGITKMLDYAALTTVIDRLIDSWAEDFRPPFSVLREAYRDEVRRREIDRVPPLVSSAPSAPISRGREIVAAQYLKQCRLEGREPDMAHHELLLTPRAQKPTSPTTDVQEGL